MSRYNITYGGDVIPIEDRQEKKLPFTISNIGGAEELKEWKQTQFRKEQVWQSGAQERRDKHVNNIIDGSYLNRKETINDKVDKRFKELESLTSTKLPQKVWPNDFPVKTIKPSLLDKALNFFLNIKF